MTPAVAALLKGELQMSSRSARAGVAAGVPKSVLEAIIQEFWNSRWRRWLLYPAAAFGLIFLIWQSLPDSVKENMISGVWAPPDPAANYDYTAVEILNRKVLIDLSLWKQVPDHMKKEFRGSPEARHEVLTVRKTNADATRKFLLQAWCRMPSC